jgi:general secretion pathway protein G
MRYTTLNSRAARSAARGFTLIELLLVMVILAILAAVVVPKFTGSTLKAQMTAAKTDISNLKVALDAFEIDNGRFPTSEEGLQALITNPADLPNWTHAYIDKLPVDPWKNQYIYRCPGSNGKDYDLASGGPTGQEGATPGLTND